MLPLLIHAYRINTLVPSPKPLMSTFLLSAFPTFHISNYSALPP